MGADARTTRRLAVRGTRAGHRLGCHRQRSEAESSVQRDAYSLHMTNNGSVSEAREPLRDYFVRLFEYDHWANQYVMETMATIETLPAKPLDRMSHLIICQQLWLSRMTDDFERPNDIFPHWTLAEANAGADAIFARMAQLISELTDELLGQPFQYRSIDGQHFESLRSEILTQLALHGSYHRGQIAVELNPLLDKPLTTDFIYRTQRPL